jgi:hypothetical protein
VDASFVPVVVSCVCGTDALGTANTKVWWKRCDNITVTIGGIGQEVLMTKTQNSAI